MKASRFLVSTLKEAPSDAEIASQATIDLAALPCGAIHADLFRDNVLWDTDADGGVHIGGVIDFVKAKKRAKNDVYICFDEWNVWYRTRRPRRAGQLEPDDLRRLACARVWRAAAAPDADL